MIFLKFIITPKSNLSVLSQWHDFPLWIVQDFVTKYAQSFSHPCDIASIQFIYPYAIFTHYTVIVITLNSYLLDDSRIRKST